MSKEGRFQKRPSWPIKRSFSRNQCSRWTSELLLSPLLAGIVNRPLEVRIDHMRRSMLSKSQVHLWQQCTILCVLAEQIRVWNGATDLPHTLSSTPVLSVGLIPYLPRAEVGVEVSGRTIISQGYERTAGIVRAQGRAASFKSRQVRLEGAA